MLVISKLFVLAAAATSVLATDYATVLNDLKTLVDPDVVSLGNLAQSYTGTNQQAISIGTAVTKLKNDISTTTSDTNAAPVPAASDAQTVLDYINGQLLTDTKNTVQYTKDKRATFDSKGLKPTVKGYFVDVKAKLDDLANALISKAPNSSLQSAGQTTKTTYDNLLNDAIAYFS